ncbi:MAG: HAMP domain-containing protein [Elusimicrobia bacterium]|nr:HAMP domain-containing protein [Elusimicrobiota bacterium]
MLKRLNKLSVKLCILSSILILAVISIMARLLMDEAKSSLIAEIRARSDSFARASREAFFPKIDIFSLHLQVNEMGKHKAVSQAFIIDSNRKILSHSIPEKIGENDSSPFVREAAGSKTPLFEKHAGEKKFEHYFISFPVSFGNERFGSIIVVMDSKSINMALRQTRNKIIAISFFALLAALSGTIIIVNWLTRPIPLLARAAEEVGKGRLEVEVKWKSSDEMGFLINSFNSMVSGLRERNSIRNIFGKYVSPEVAEIVLRQGNLALAGEQRDISVLFADIRDFSKLSAKIPPEEVVQMLNAYFSSMTKLILQHNGSIDKYIGDGLLALFGAPLQLKKASVHALDAGLEMFTFVESFNAERIGKGLDPIKIGVCVTSGTAVIGNIGSEEHLEYTAIGEPVNLAARLEGLNKRFGTSFLASQKVFLENEQEFRFKELGSQKVRGWEFPVEVYEVLGKQIVNQEKPRA